MKKGIKMYILPLILVVALVWPVLGLAADVPGLPEYSEEAAAAVPTITVSGNVEPGEVIFVTVAKAESALASTAAISTKGLQFLRTDSRFGTQTNVAFMSQVNRVTYQYKVSGAPETIVSFNLSDVNVLLSEDGEEEPAPPVRWRATVTGDPVGSPTPSPTTMPTASPTKPSITGPVELTGPAKITVTGDFRSGGEIQAHISCAADGLEGAVRTQGLEFVEVDNLLSSSSRVVLVNMGQGESTGAVYTYRISASPGELISIDVDDVIISVDGEDVPGERSVWIDFVEEDSSSGHSFGLTGGLSITGLPSGRSAVVGLTAQRTPLQVRDLMRHVVEPSNGRVVVRDYRGNTLARSSRIMSGCSLVVLSESGTPTGETAVVALTGDVMGTGTASISQVVTIAKFLTGQSNPTELQQVCADYNQNGRLEISDLVGCAQQLNR